MSPVFFIYSIICIVGSYIWPVLFCFFADQTTNRMSAIANDVYDLNWYEFPPKWRRYLILITAYSQRPVYFDGFDLVQCTLVTFTKSCKFQTFQPIQ